MIEKKNSKFENKGLVIEHGCRITAEEGHASSLQPPSCVICLSDSLAKATLQADAHLPLLLASSNSIPRPSNPFLKDRGR